MSTNDNIIMGNNANHKDIYIQLKAILEGCDTVLDAIPFYNMYSEKYPEMKNMIHSLIYGKNYQDSLDIVSKQVMLNDIVLCDDKNNAINMMSKLVKKTNEPVYKRTIERIVNSKQYRKINNTKINNNVNISKNCPHCSHVMNMPKNTDYVICGYSNTKQGYDWNGCGKDWCFRCNKMLCKSWESDTLNLKMNRYHDDDCCSKHAKLNKYIYPDDYCKCDNIYVRRETNDIMKSIIA